MHFSLSGECFLRYGFVFSDNNYLQKLFFPICWANYNNYSPRIIAWKTNKIKENLGKNKTNLRKTKKNLLKTIIIAFYYPIIIIPAIWFFFTYPPPPKRRPHPPNGGRGRGAGGFFWDTVHGLGPPPLFFVLRCFANNAFGMVHCDHLAIMPLPMAWR